MSNFKEAPEIAALTGEIEAQKDLIRDACKRLGKAYYDAHKDDDEAVMDEDVKAIRAATETIKANQEKIRTLKGLTLCPECKAEVSVNAMFCNRCGCRLREPEPEPVAEPAAQPRLCPTCGKALREGQKFCTGCGTPVAAVEAPAPVPEKKLCPNCGTELQPNAKFCFECGSPV